MLQEIKDVNKLKEITKEAVLKYTDKIEENRQLRTRVAELEQANADLNKQLITAWALVQEHQTCQTKQGNKEVFANKQTKS